MGTSADQRPSLADRALRKVMGEKAWLARRGNFRQKERAGLVGRANYAYGMLRAADMAAHFGHRAVSVCEFGVAKGWGLLNMASLAKSIGRETGIQIHVYGFDTGKGLPPPTSYKDHPELWGPGDFSMEDPAELQSRLGSDARLIIGDIANTIEDFRGSLGPEAPLGFVSVDVDIYSATVSSLKVLAGSTDKYLPAISFYLDDVRSYFNNPACGELCAIAEHNVAWPSRLIDIDRSLRGNRLDEGAGWHQAMYVCHVLDHPARNSPRSREALGLIDHLRHMGPLR